MRSSVATALVALTLVVAACADDGSTGPDADPAAGGTTAATTAAPGTTSVGTAAHPATTTASGFEEITFDTADGLTLEGRLYGAGPTLVVLGHMFPADQSSWFAFAEALQAEGFSALTYNNRGYGKSDAGGELLVATDARAAIAAARANGAETVFFFGASMNGAAALQVAAEGDLAGLAMLSAVQLFEDADGVGSAPQVTEPKLFVAAEDDAAAVIDAQALFDASPQPKELLVLEQGGHGTDMFRANPGLAVRLIEFVEANA